MTYDDHRLQTMVDPNVNTAVENIYGLTTGRVTAQRDANTVASAEVIAADATGEPVPGPRQDLTFDYTTPGQTTVTDRRGQPTVFAYDAGYRVGDIADATGAHAYRTWDVSNDLTCVADRKGHRTRYVYDGRGNVARMSDPLN